MPKQNKIEIENKLVSITQINDEYGKIPDYTLLKNGKTTLIVEAKNLSVDLQNKKNRQIPDNGAYFDQRKIDCFKRN